MGEFHVIFGAGPVGAATARVLLDSGAKVRLASRSGSRPKAFVNTLGPGEESRIEFVRADAADTAAASAATEGATHVYDCVNLPYQQWYKDLLPIRSSLIEAAMRHSATLAAAENLYTFSRGLESIDEDSPEDPPTRKGRLQAARHALLVDAGRKHGLAWTAVRASDFYGPGATSQSVFGTDRFLDPMVAGKAAMVFGDPDLPHSYTYVGDYGKALAIAASRPEARGRSWIVPNDRTTSTRELAATFFAAAGMPLNLFVLPEAAIAALGLFDPLVREFREMLYQKKEPYRIDGSRFRATFGLEATPVSVGVRQTLEWQAATRVAGSGRS
jgi:nucleoside-diphosphate-sugar epimerase